VRSVASMAGLLIVALIAGLLYKYYFQRGSPSGAIEHPVQTINTMGVQNDLVNMAQAERLYQAEHGSYASLEELTSSGALPVKKTGREGYTYDVETSAESFRIVARCASSALPGCVNYAIDQTMELHPLP